MLISGGGTLVRTRVNEISVMGRNTQGVRLIKLANSENLVGMERIVEVRDESETADVEDATGATPSADSE